MIRSLAPDELEWFIAASFSFLGHSDARGFARRARGKLRDPTREAERSFVLFGADAHPLAGAYLLAPEPTGDEQTLHLSNLWFARRAEDLQELLEHQLERCHFEAARAPLHNYAPSRIEAVRPVLESLGFKLEHARDMTFELADVPPLGAPLLLESWSEEADPLFRHVFEQAEQQHPSDELWAHLKRWRGPFMPDLWFIARQTLDQEPVGYAFYGAFRGSAAGSYYLTAAGALAKYRESSEMLRRLLLSSLQELAALSPLGRLETFVNEDDPKLTQILESLGFSTSSRYPVFSKRPT